MKWVVMDSGPQTPETEEQLLRWLGHAPRCPQCGAPLVRDPLWSHPYFVDDQGHSFSNLRVLVEEMQQAHPIDPQ